MTEPLATWTVRHDEEPDDEDRLAIVSRDATELWPIEVKLPEIGRTKTLVLSIREATDLYRAIMYAVKYREDTNAE